MTPFAICLVGPTGTGKSNLALTLAERFRGAVINADSRQLYRDFPLITAQPSPEDRARCPHELYGFLATEESYTAGRWAADALERICQKGRLPLLVGGTGFYIRALLHGIVNIPPIPEDITRSLDELFASGQGAPLYNRLTSVDPAYAARIHPNDRQRLVRALAVFEATGHTFSWWHSQTPPPPKLHVLQIALGLPLDELTPRLAQRIDTMMLCGALEEAAAARQHCDNPEAPGWSGIGCAELYQYLSGKITLEEARVLWIKNTRAYAKRQLTWFRADPHLHWFRPEELSAAVALAAR